MKLSILTSTALALVISAGAAFAQATTPANPTPTAPRGSPPSTTAPAPSTTAPMATSPSPTATPSTRMKSGMTKMKKAMAPRSASSMKCSTEANAKGLHGKARKSFRKSCMKMGMGAGMKKMDMKKMN